MSYAALWRETYQRICLPSVTAPAPASAPSSPLGSSFIPSADEAVAKTKAPISRGERVAKDILAGTMGGIVVTLSGHPFDTLKVLLQTQDSANPAYKGLGDAFRQTVRKEGLGGLYRGVASPLLGQMFFRATLFLSYANMKEFFSDGGKRTLTVADYALAGGCAWSLASLAEGPIDFYKSQAQSQLIKSSQDPNYVPKFRNMSEVARASIRINGIAGPYQGFTATLMRNFPAASVYFGTFEYLKIKFAEQEGCSVNEISNWKLLFSGGFGGVVYWSCFYPIDVIKSAMMTDSLVKSERQYPTVIKTAAKLYQEGGIARFYKGISPCLLRSMPANALMLFTVDKFRYMLGIA